MSINNKKNDTMSTLVAVMATVVAIIMLFVDWRYSLLAVLVVWNQLVFKDYIEGRKVRFRYFLSLVLIVGLTLYLLFE